MNSTPTDSELEILRILWEINPATVREVNDRINEGRESGYTTTLKLLQIMHEKGIVKREKSGKQHLYSPALNMETTQNALLDRFLETAFGGSAMKLVLQALGSQKTSKEEIKKIREYLDKMEGGKI